MQYQKEVRKLVRDPKMENLRELIIRVTSIVTEKNVGNLFLQNIPDGIKKSLNEIRRVMREHNIPAPEDNRDLYEKIIQPAFLEMIQAGK